MYERRIAVIAAVASALSILRAYHAIKTVHWP